MRQRRILLDHVCSIITLKLLKQNEIAMET